MIEKPLLRRYNKRRSKNFLLTGPQTSFRLSERQKEKITELAEKGYRGNKSIAICDSIDRNHYLNGLSHPGEEPSFRALSTDLGSLISLLAQRLGEKISLQDVTDLVYLQQTRQTVEGFYKRIEEIYKSLEPASPYVQLNEPPTQPSL